MEDITISLPQDTKLTALRVSADETKYSELMQRAVMLLMTSTDERLTVDGYTLPQMIYNSTDAGIPEINRLAGFYEDALRSMLNEDSYEVSALAISVEGGNPVNVTINITKADDSEVLGEFTLI